MDITEGFVEELELVLMGQIETLKEADEELGFCLSPIEIAASLCNPEYGGGKDTLSNLEHTTALATIAAIAISWLAYSREEEDENEYI